LNSGILFSLYIYDLCGLNESAAIFLFDPGAEVFGYSRDTIQDPLA